MSINIAHCRETSNTLNASVRCQQKRLQRLSTVFANNRIPKAVWQEIPDIGVNFYKAARLEPPTFQTPRLSGFWAPHFFVTCNVYYEAVFCGLPNNKMTPNDIHANQTTIMSLSTHDRSGLSHGIVQPGTVDNSVLSLIISVLSFKGIHNGICNL